MTAQSAFGVNVWWTVPETSLDGLRVQTVLVKHGFEATEMKIPSRQTEVSRTVKSFQNRRGSDDRCIGETVSRTAKAVVYGILDHKQESDDEVSFIQNTTVILDKETGAVSADGILQEAFGKALAGFEGKITDQDIRTFLRNVIRQCFGVEKRPTGGFYFVPAQFVEIIERAQMVLEDLNSRAHIYMERVMDGPQERQNVWDSVEADIEDRVAETVAAVERISRRKSALKSREAQIAEADELMKVYQALLGEEAKYEEAAEKIDAAVKLVTEKLAGFAAADASKPPKAPKPPKSPEVSESSKQEGEKTGVTVVEAAVKVLTEAGKALSGHEIVETAMKQGLYLAKCEKPYDSFVSTLQRVIRNGDKRMRRVGRGMYEIAA